MKQAIVMGMQIGLGAALSLVLGADSAAQRTGGRSLELSVDLVESAAIDAHALIPRASDFAKRLTLSGGAPGSVAAIEVGSTGGGGGSFSRCAVFTGPIGSAGTFEVVLPPSLDVRGLGARGAQAPTRMVSVLVDLDEAVEEAYASWEILNGLPRPAGGFTGGGRVLVPGRIPGHLGQAQVRDGMRSMGVDLGGAPGAGGIEVGWQVLGNLPRPGGVSTGGPLQPRAPSHVGQAQAPSGMHSVGVDLSGGSAGGIGVGSQILGQVPRPQGGVAHGGHSRGGVIVCPPNFPERGFDVLDRVARPQSKGRPETNSGGRTARGTRP